MTTDTPQSTDLHTDLHAQWLALRDRLQAKRLLDGPGASLSLRIPGQPAMWVGTADDAAPRRVSWDPRTAPGAQAPQDLHAMVYRHRDDAGAVAWGGGVFGHRLADVGGVLPQVFDEQARHLGPMGAPAADLTEAAQALQAGGQVQLLQGRPLCLGMTATRLALNTELFEKCAKAYVLAAASGGPVRPLPWLVRRVANGRLRKDRRAAVARWAQGLLPQEAKGY
ncbi:hypothetical protein [Ideonella sp. B508-1]|uniref:hypothetical protein n=1 Tax=Ideonella sp. B508-1 TaxID=137716 RepID=UPI00034A79BE|nr:hypothetical protein [Ideonella sp. B508-1]